MSHHYHDGGSFSSGNETGLRDDAAYHVWEYTYPAGISRCRVCGDLDLGRPRPCRGWKYDANGDRVYPEADAKPA